MAIKIAMTILCFAAMMTCSTFAPAAPIPASAITPSLHFPTKVGTKWVYGGIFEDLVYTINDSNQIDGYTVVSIYSHWYIEQTNKKGKNKFSHRLAISSKGIYEIEDETGLHLSPRLLVPTTWKSGELHEKALNPFNYTNIQNERVVTIYGPEAVEVPAGKFNAIRAKCVCTCPRFRYEETRTDWYVPHIGFIKKSIRTSNQSADNCAESLLKSFTLIKD